jgi:ubiquinone/menaquinone biosynthesis C-methylase UbiE
VCSLERIRDANADTLALALAESQEGKRLVNEQAQVGCHSGNQSMTDMASWKQVWEQQSRADVPDFELDRGMSPRDRETEDLSEKELISFIEPGELEVLLDAGCGTGLNIVRLHSRVRSIVGIDFAWGSLERCRSRVQAHQARNAQICQASISAIPLPDCSVDKILCLSVLQYLDDEEVRRVFREFVRVSSLGGIIILHVKNLSSLYWLTLRFAKKLKVFLGWTTEAYYLRSFRWYVNELASVNCRVLDYKSFNLLTLDFMPRWLVHYLQGLELRWNTGVIFRVPFIRRHGADLKIKAVVDRRLGHTE